MDIRSRLKPEGSLTAGIATMGLVYSIYQLNVGPVSSAQASDANHPINESTRKKAGYTSFVAVSGIALLSKDMNVGILGFASIVAMECTYRHAIMSDPITGRIQPPAGTAYSPAQNVVPLMQQGQAVS
jgi:hypothetical protein